MWQKKLYSNGISESCLRENDSVLGQHLEKSLSIQSRTMGKPVVTSHRLSLGMGNVAMLLGFKKKKKASSNGYKRLCFSDGRKAAEYASECQP